MSRHDIDISTRFFGQMFKRLSRHRGKGQDPEEEAQLDQVVEEEEDSDSSSDEDDESALRAALAMDLSAARAACMRSTSASNLEFSTCISCREGA